MADFDSSRFARSSTTRGQVKAPVTSNIVRQMASLSNFARPTRFYFEIAQISAAFNERLNRNCVTISMPGRAIQSQPNKIYGPPAEYAYEANYTNEVSMTFRVSDDMFERDFFERWMGNTVRQVSSDLNYPDEYRTTMKIYQLDTQDNYLYCSELQNVFCKNIGDMEYSSDSTDQILTVTANLTFSEYYIIGRVQPKAGDIPPPSDNDPLNLQRFIDNASVQMMVPNAILRYNP